MNKVKEWEELKKDYENAMSMSCKPRFKKVSANHIFDENETVKWNREKVIEYNKSYDERKKELIEKRNNSLNSVIEEIIDKIAYELSIPNSRAKIVWEYVHDRKDCFYYELFTELEEIIEVMYNTFRC